MSQRQNRRVEKGEPKTQFRSCRPGRPSRANSTHKRKYQWVSSAKVSGRGGDSDNAGVPPPPPNYPYSTNSRSFSSVKNTNGQGSQSTLPGASSESNTVQNASLEKSKLSGTSDASTSKALVRHILHYRKRDTEIVSGAVSSEFQSETSDSATTRTHSRGDPSSQASLQFGRSRDFANEMQLDHNSFKRETAASTSSISRKQQKRTVWEQTKNRSSQLQPKENMERSKNETRHLQSKPKRYIPVNHNASKPGVTDKSPMSSKQFQKQDQEHSENENPHLQPKHDLEPSKNENALQPKGDWEQSKNGTPDLQREDDLEQSNSETPYLQPRTKRYTHVQRKLSKPGATVPMSYVSSKQDAKQYFGKFNAKTPWLKAGEDFEESKDETLNPQPMVKRHNQVHNNFFEPEVTVSSSYISGRQQQKEDLKQSRKEAPNLQPEAERDNTHKGITAVVTGKQGVSLAVPQVPLTTSSFQQSLTSNRLGIPGPHTWAQGMTSTSFQMPVQLPSENSSQVAQPPFVPSLQPYHLQPQGVMHSDTRYDFSPQVGHQLGSQFGSFNGITSNYMHNYHKKAASQSSVKITHPETNEELILDNSANRRLGPIRHHHMGLPPHPVTYGPSPPMHYFSHVQPNSFSFQGPTSVSFRSSQMLSRTPKLGFNSLGMHDVAVATNTGHGSLASIPVSEQAATFVGENKSSVSIRLATNGRNQATKPMDPLRLGSEEGKSQYYSKGFLELPNSVATAVPLGASSATVSVEGVPFGKNASAGINNVGETIAAIGGRNATMKKSQNLSEKHDFQSQKLSQANTSDFPDNYNMKSLEVGECRNNTLAPLEEIQQSDTVWGSPLGSEPSIPGSSKLEMINLEANYSLVDSCESSLVSSQVCLPGAQQGYHCASVGVPDDLQPGKDLIHGVSSKYIGQNTNMEDAVSVKDAENNNYVLSEIQVDAKTEELSEQGTELFEHPFLHSTWKDGSLNNLRSLEFNQQTTKDHSIAETSASDKHAISGFEQDRSQSSLDTWNSVTEKTGDALVEYISSLSHGTDSMFGSPTLDSSLEYPEVGVEALESRAEPIKRKEISLSESGYQNHEVPSLDIGSSSSSIEISEVKMSERPNADSFFMFHHLRQEDDPISNSIMMEGASFKGKQKREEVLYKADAAGASSDLHMAYKECDKKLQLSDFSNSRGNSADISPRQIFSIPNNYVGANKNVKSKTEPGHWKGVEISTSELEISNKFEVQQNNGYAALDHIESSGRKSYSRDFLLTLSKQFTEFPAGFQLVPEMAEGLISSPRARVSQDHNSNPSVVENTDGAGSSSVDHRGRRKDGHRRWTKLPTLDAFQTKQYFGINGEASSFHPGRTGIYNRKLHGQEPGQYASGIFTGLLPHPTSQRGRIRKGAGVDQWQRATVFQKDLISSPRPPFQAMHKAERKYEVHKVMDAEEAKQRQLKAILNKLTPQNFDKLFEQVKEVNVDSAVTLAGLISQILDKALMEPTFSEMYAKFCYHLASQLPDFVEDHEKITFKRLLLNKCQEEFERGEREQAEADRTDREGEVRFSEEEREEKRTHARRRMLGNIRLIGELYKKKMLTERIMHECIEKLLGNDQFPEEEDIEALCKLMCTIGEIIDHPKAKEHMDAYFEIMLNLSNNGELSTRMKFMLKDVIDLRKNKWRQRRKVEGPKKIEELHSDAAQERRAVGSQLTYAPSIFSSNKRNSTNSGSRPSTYRSPRKFERAAFHAMSSKSHGFANPDIRSEDTKPYQYETLSVPFPHRSNDDNIMTVGLQGGRTKGMPVRNPTMFYGSPQYDSHTDFGGSRKVPTDRNGYSSIPEWRPYNNLKQQLTPKYAPDIFMQAPVYDPSNRQVHYVNRGPNSAHGSFGRSPLTGRTISPSRPTLSSKFSSGKRWSDEYLREMSVAAIREFYSTGDENDVFQYVGDMNSPSFYPSMISIWVKDSFERKNRERDLLAGLLVSLTKSRAGVLTTSQLIKGFELVLATLEAAFTDAAKAAAFLGQLFGRIVTKSVLSLKEIKRIVHRYGKLPGHQPQDKLCYAVMKIAFETIRSEKGESVLKEMCRRSNVQLDDFRPSSALEQ